MNGAAPEAFRLATLDIGGGTTDLVISSFRVEGQGANVTLYPKQEFREVSISRDDDAVFRIVREHVLEPIRRPCRRRVSASDRLPAESSVRRRPG